MRQFAAMAEAAGGKLATLHQSCEAARLNDRPWVESPQS
jgi:hypothetical protein